MGIHDRHYYRQTEPRRPGLAALRMMSINTWLIVLCVAVFVIDQLSPPQTWKAVPISSTMPIDAQLQIGSGGGTKYRQIPVMDERLNLRTQQRGFVRQVADYSKQPPEPLGMITYAYMPPLAHWLHFSTFTAIKGVEFWRFIGFQFLHANTTHLLFNMIGLFFFGPIVEQYLGAKRYLAFYLLCGIFGALMYLFLNLAGITTTVLFQDDTVRVPGLLFSSLFTPLVGASAGIFGVLMAGAFLMPRAQVLLFFFLPMQLRTLAYVLVAIALLSLITGGHNAGGEAGHLGGAIAGFYFIRRPHHLHGFFDFLGRVDPTSHHYRKTGAAPRHRYAAPVRTAEVDRILDKINREGLHGLTDEEKRILSDASRRE